MRRIIVAVATLFMVLSMTFIVLILSGGQDNFTGSRTKNPDAYLLDFEFMTQEDSHTLTLQKDDEIRIEYTIEKGKVDLEIREAGGGFAYRGKDLDTGEFTVVATESGDYQILVKAKRAKGFLYITKQ